MNEINVLHYDENGHVAFCPDCSHFQLIYSNIALNLSGKELETIYSLVSDDLKTFRNRIDPEEKSFIYNTGMLKVRMLFSFNDLEKIFNILSPARVIIKAKKLIEGQSEKSL